MPLPPFVAPAVLAVYQVFVRSKYRYKYTTFYRFIIPRISYVVYFVYNQHILSSVFT